MLVVIFAGDPQLCPVSLGPITASFIPDLPLVPDKVKQFLLEKASPFSRVSKSYIVKVRGCIMNWKMSVILLPI